MRLMAYFERLERDCQRNSGSRGRERRIKVKSQVWLGVWFGYIEVFCQIPDQFVCALPLRLTVKNAHTNMQVRHK